MTVGLAMIVRDNAEVLERCLLSARDHVDAWTIVDTGSTDGTPGIVRDLMAGIPGSLHEREWRFSGHNRTELLALARGTAGYLLLLDADHELDAGSSLPELDAPAYMLIERDHGLEHRMPRLVRGDREWRYVGAAHEYLEGTEGRENLDEWSVIHHGDGRTPTAKLETARVELEQALIADPTDARSVFYLAQTHRDLGNIGEAIHFYTRRTLMVGWDEETFYAHYRLGCLLTENVSLDAGAAQLLAAHRLRPHRAEPLTALAHAAADIADRLPLPDDLLFVHTDQYKAAA